jgi:uncharacterized membrane protein YcaP (DUF421 family)
LNDWHRILFGNAPAVFMVEILFRTVIIYIFLLMIVTWLGKRMAGQITIFELGIAIMIGAIVAPPMETPERGIIQGIAILFLVLILHQLLSTLALKSRRFESVSKGKLSICVKDGIIQVHELKKIRVSRAQLFTILRARHIYNLAAVKRMYMESCGLFTVFKTQDPRPGLSLLPPGDPGIHAMHQQPDPQLKACTSCGNTTRSPAADERCAICGSASWDTAVL